MNPELALGWLVFAAALVVLELGSVGAVFVAYILASAYRDWRRWMS